MRDTRKMRNISKTHTNERLDEGLLDTFPASDPVTETEPGSGITANEPPIPGQKLSDRSRAAKKTP